MSARTLTVGGVAYGVEYDYSPGERGGWDSPPMPESWDVYSVRLVGTEIELLDLLRPDVLGAIEDELERARDRERREREQDEHFDNQGA